MNVEASELYRAMREYVEAAMRLLADLCPKGPPSVIVGLDEWRRGPDNLFRRRDHEEPFWVGCIRKHEGQIHSLDEYDRLVAVLRAIPHIDEQLENLVGTARSGRRIEISHVTDHLLWQLPPITGGLRFDEAQFSQLFDKFEADLQRTSFSYVVIVPLLGLKLESAPIQLGSDIAIDDMTDDETVRCLRLGFLPDPFGPPGMAGVKSPAAVRVRYDLEKHVGPHVTSKTEEAPTVQATAIERATAILHALHVFKDGRVSIPGLVHFSPDWPLEGSTNFQYLNPGRMPWFNKYDLPRNEVDEFSAFWKRFQNVTTKGALANAARRFSYASDRDRYDDRLVDLMIAAESLFLADIKERGELKYRLSLRAAFFIESPEYSRREIFKHMKRAYDARSAVVHGLGEPGREQLKTPTGDPLSLPDFVKVTEDLVRIALKKAIDMADATGSRAIDWDALIIPS